MDKKIPNYFNSILWSYDPKKIDSEKHKKTIIINAINYGDLRHWRWIKNTYGTETIREILSKIPATEIKSRTRRLASIIFSIKNYNYAPRGTY
ncbi:hypothetical protein KKB69_02580 [Patescibacteria group bacterium]|nr:hypothetical protein [Patescibacteria group bacterium]